MRGLLRTSVLLIAVAALLVGCGTGNESYQPKPEDIPEIPSGNRDAGSNDTEFLPPGR